MGTLNKALGCNTDIHFNQLKLRAEDAALMGEAVLPDSENIYLPASFLGSRLWSMNQVADALAIAAVHGPPTFCVTMTCNSAWPEIQSELLPGQDYMDIPLVVVHVFWRKLSVLLSALKTMFPSAGSIVYLMYSVEFQKRGLPHAHMLIKYRHDCVTAADIDNVISAEIPPDHEDAELV